MLDTPERVSVLATLAERLGVQFNQLEWLDRALTHASIAGETAGPQYDYETLEFLGDAVLGLAVAQYLFERVPDRTPGEYSRMRASVVNRRCLARIAQVLDLAPAIRLGRGEELAGGRTRTALLADCLEAVIGALYRDCGWETARQFIERAFAVELQRAAQADRIWDFKSRLQHYCQAERIPLPVFDVVRSEGPDHLKEFDVEVLLRGEAAGRGTGFSKKEAEQNAARAALERAGLLSSGSK